MKKIIIGTIILLIAISCNKEKGENIFMFQTFSFFDKNGNDLFNQNITNHLDTSDIKAYSLSGGEEGIVYGKFDGVYQFDIPINSVDYTTTIQLGEITTDTIFANYKEVGNSLFIHQVYYNGQLVMTNEQPTECGSGKVVSVVVKQD